MSYLIKLCLRKIRILFLIYFKYFLKNVGKNFYCGKSLWIWRKAKLTIGDNVYIGNYCHIGVKNLKIGNDTLIASQVSFVGGDHVYNDKNKKIRDTSIDEKMSISIGEDCWIGHGAIILNGVSIGNGSVVGAGSIVTKNIPPEKIVVGNPAKVIKDRFGK